jgi:hypothetical protein
MKKISQAFDLYRFYECQQKFKLFHGCGDGRVFSEFTAFRFSGTSLARYAGAPIAVWRPILEMSATDARFTDFTTPTPSLAA